MHANNKNVPHTNEFQGRSQTYMGPEANQSGVSKGVRGHPP